MKKITLLILLSLSVNISAQINFSQNPREFSTKGIEKFKAPQLQSLEQAAQWADLVALAQVDEIEYKQVRNLNAKGYAFLNVLVSYKGSIRGETIAVVATGFDDEVCYYPDRKNEGERFLVFLKKAPNELKNVYYGFKPFCQLQILLSDLGQYVLRTPLGFELEDINIKQLSQETTFVDPHAMVDTTLWTSIKRQKYADKFQCKLLESEDKYNKVFQLRYTHGIPIYKIRPLLKIKYKPKINSKNI